MSIAKRHFRFFHTELHWKRFGLHEELWALLVLSERTTNYNFLLTKPTDGCKPEDCRLGWSHSIVLFVVRGQKGTGSSATSLLQDELNHEGNTDVCCIHLLRGAGRGPGPSES